MSHVIMLGIDPGLQGAVVGLTADRQLWRYADQPTLKETKSRRGLDIGATWQEVESWGQAARADGLRLAAILEQGSPRPREGVRSAYSTGRAVTLWEVILTALQIRYQLVRPNVWTRQALKGIRAEGKDRAILRAEREIPELPCRGPRGGKLTGRADAACMALYGLEAWG